MSIIELCAIVAVVGLVVVLAKGNDVRAAFNFLGVGFFELEAKKPKSKPRPKPNAGHGKLPPATES
jgi:hypothetical protein